MKIRLQLIILIFCTANLYGQSFTGSFVATLGTDTVIVETYNMLPNHLFGKAFLRYPQDQIGVFDFHFYPDGSIQSYSISYMDPDNSAVTKSATEGIICQNDTCTYFNASLGGKTEYVNKYTVKHIDFMGGWTPTLSLIQWNCMRLIKSGKQSLSLNLLNDYIGVRQIGIYKGNKDTILFGGPFLEYTRITTTPDGRILSYDGTATPWNYVVTKHDPIYIDEIANRMSKKPKIGIPSPEVKMNFPIAGDTISLSYGRPSKRGRKIFGGVVPFDSVWRTGASNATRINLPFDIQIGKTVIPKGQYSLYTIPRLNKEWSLIFNTDLKRWPTDPDRTKDFALVALQIRNPGLQIDQFTIDIEAVKDGGIIKFTWDDTEAFAPFNIVKK
jgi:Protein of unknown function (DUF2911)